MSDKRRVGVGQEGTGQTAFSFLLKTHLPDYHPGVVKIQGRLGTSTHDVGGYGGVLLYHGTPGEGGAALTIAEAIYAEETRPRQASTLRDPRFDFASPCLITLAQITGSESVRSWADGKTVPKKVVGSLALPGGQSREQVCQAIADTIVAGWVRPPDTAYILPERLTSEQGTIIYNEDGRLMEQLVAFPSNGRVLEGPLLLYAWSQGCIRFATLHLGPPDSKEVQLCYHLCTLLETERGWLYCDDGFHAMDEPLTLAERGEAGAAWSYTTQHVAYGLMIRDSENATHVWSWEDRERARDLPRLLQAATLECSLFCPACRRSWLWEANARELQQPGTSDRVLTLCPHCWFCPACTQWATPLTPAMTYERSSCRHSRPDLPEQRLPVQDSHAATIWRGERISVPPARFVREVPPPGAIEHDVLVTFLTRLPHEGNGTGPEQSVPAGTRLVARWESRQPETGKHVCLSIGDERWLLPVEHVSVCCFLTPLAPLRTQFALARESVQAARELDAQGDHLTALETLERALLELSVSDALPADLAAPRFRYAQLLLEAGERERASSEMEQAAQCFERAVKVPSPVSSPKTHAEREVLAIKALVALGNLYLQQGRTDEELLAVAQRLHHFEDDLKQRLSQYRTPVIETRLFTALLYATAHDTKQATYLLRLAEALIKGDPGADDQGAYVVPMARLRAVLYPEERLLQRLQAAQADLRQATLEQIQAAEQALFAQLERGSEQCFYILLRVKGTGRAWGQVRLEEYRPGSGSRPLGNGALLSLEDLIRQGTEASAAMLAESMYRDLEARGGKDWRDRVLDFRQEITLVLLLAVEAEMKDEEMRSARSTFFAFARCALPGRTARPEALRLLAEQLIEGLRILERVVVPGEPGVWPDGAGPGGLLVGPGEGQEDLPVLARIRRYGSTRPDADTYRSCARDVLRWVRTHLAAGEGQECQFWQGETQLVLGRFYVEVQPREIVWAMARDADLPLTSELWPRCGQPTCILPDHQLEVISPSNAAHALEARVGGPENAQYLIEEGKRSGVLHLYTGYAGALALARAEFEAWSRSRAFGERYLSGKQDPQTPPQPEVSVGQPHASQLQSRIAQLDGTQRAAVLEVWGGQGEGSGPEEAVQAWLHRVNTASAARFVWPNLGPPEQAVLWAVVEASARQGSQRATLLRKTGLAPAELDAALERLEALLLLQVDYLLQGEVQQFIGCNGDYGDALRQTGAEVFSPEDRSLWTLAEHLEHLSRAELTTLAQRYGLSIPRSSPDASTRRLLSEALVGDPGRLFSALNWLDSAAQRLVACVYEHEGRQLFEEALTCAGIERPALHAILQATADLGLLFDALVPGGKRVLFLAADVYEASKRLSVAPRTLWQLDHLLQPSFVFAGQPLLLYDLVVLLWHVSHLTVELTKNDSIALRVAKKVFSFLHILPREGPEGDLRVELLDYLAWYWDLEQKSVIPDVKTHYVPGEGLDEWAQYDLATQARLAFVWWLDSPEWVDLVASDCRTGEIPQPREEARQVLVRALQALKPEEWYPISDFLVLLWESALSSPVPASSAVVSRSQVRSEAARERWMRADGLLYQGMLASTLHEIGIVTLGYHHSPETLDVRLQPDLLQLTQLGKDVLSSPLMDFPPEGTQAPADDHPLIVQPNFEVLVLAPDMRALYSILPFVEIQQIERVSRLRLTQTALDNGMRQGHKSDRIIALLAGLAKKGLPQNVEYSLQEWARKHLSAQLSQVVLIEVPTEYAAQALSRLEGFGDLGMRQLAPCCFAVNPARLPAVRRFFFQHGISFRVVE
jgi:tetratricopeptide (TPR) repeat protein